MAKSNKRKIRKNVSHAVVHIKATFNNTLITITDTNGDVPIAASSLVVLVCVTTTLWLGLDLFGTTLASLPAAAD